MSKSHYHISLATPEQIPTLAAIEVAAAAKFPLDIIPEEIRSGSVPVSQLKAAQSDGRLWVACDAGQVPVGFAIARLEGDAGFLQELDVHPDHQRQGLGRRLIDVVIEWSQAQGCRRLTLTTFASVPWNAPYYARLGFRVLESEELSNSLQSQLESEISQGMKDRVAMVFPLIQ